MPRTISPSTSNSRRVRLAPTRVLFEAALGERFDICTFLPSPEAISQTYAVVCRNVSETFLLGSYFRQGDYARARGPEEAE